MSAKQDQLQALEQWLIEQEDIARQNYSAAAMRNDVGPADMFANHARCAEIARDMLLEYIECMET